MVSHCRAALMSLITAPTSQWHGSAATCARIFCDTAQPAVRSHQLLRQPAARGDKKMLGSLTRALYQSVPDAEPVSAPRLSVLS